MPTTDLHTVTLRAPRPLLNAAKHSGVYHGRSLNDQLTRFTAIGLALSTLTAALEHPDAPGAAEAEEEARDDLASLLAATFGRDVADDLFATLIAGLRGVVVNTSRN